MLVSILIIAVLALIIGFAWWEIRKLKTERSISREVLEIYKLHAGQIEELEEAISRCIRKITTKPYRVIVNSGAALEIGAPNSEDLYLNASNYSVKIFSAEKVGNNQTKYLVMVADAIQSWSRQCDYAHKDQLTGVNNRKSIEHAMKREFKRAKRTNAAVTFLLLDIDDFKEFNDEYGHPHGDVVIRKVAQKTSMRIRETDIVGRYGRGDEFAIILPATSQEDAIVVAEELRKDIETEGITLSIGVASYPEYALTIEELIKKADVALYISKKKGKNRVTAAT
jgi:diguanylate cyclase (GGDEF)-like protein